VYEFALGSRRNPAFEARNARLRCAGAGRAWCLLTRTAHTGFAERARSEANATVRIHEADAEVAKTGAVPKNEAGVGRYLLRVEAYRTLFGLIADAA
jgi:hypothetical protein